MKSSKGEIFDIIASSRRRIVGLYIVLCATTRVLVFVLKQLAVSTISNGVEWEHVVELGNGNGCSLYVPTTGDPKPVEDKT